MTVQEATVETNELIALSRVGSVGIMAFQHPPLNILSRAFRIAILDALAELERDVDISHAILISSLPNFIGGGDISEFSAPPQEPHLPQVMEAVEKSRLLTIAAIAGHCFGGGFELAMACDYRVASDKARLGCPEVNIGLIPGAGATQRLPRLIGMTAAAKMLSTGHIATAQDMAELGAVDAICDGDLRAAALTWAKAHGVKPVPASQRVVEAEDLSAVLDGLKPEPKAARLNVEAVGWVASETFENAMQKERALHLKLRQDPQGRALRHLFFAERTAARPKALRAITPRPITRVAVLGGGLMGVGIATAALMAGRRVEIVEQKGEAMARARATLQSALEAAHGRGKLPFDPAQAEAHVRVISAEELGPCDLVIEAVFEDLTVKAELFKSLLLQLGPETILATNTSYLDPRGIFPHEVQDRAVGLHFFAPAQVMKLLEIVRLPDTDPQVQADVFQFARDLGKIPVACGICDGFIGNRILKKYRRQAEFLLADGAAPEEVDAAMAGFGMPMGPFALQDLSGLQIAWAERKRHPKPKPGEGRYVPIADRLCEAGRLGQRSGAGWYDYDGKTRGSNAWVKAAIDTYRQEACITARHFEAGEIQNQLLAVMANEAYLILAEGVAQSQGDVDVVKTAGFGFPRWRGGPLFYAQENHQTLKAAMTEVCEQSPNTWHLCEEFS